LLVCNWPHSVRQNHFFVKMFFIRDSVIQKCSRRFCTVCKLENSCSFVVGLILIGQNHLYVKRCFSTGIPLFRRISTICESEIPVPCQPSGKRAIPSGRSSVHSPSRWTTCHTVWTPNRQSIIHLDDVDFRLDTHLHREASVLACIRPDVSPARTDGS